MSCLRYGIPGVTKLSKNFPKARGFVLPKYEPMPTHGNPVQPTFHRVFKATLQQGYVKHAMFVNDHVDLKNQPPYNATIQTLTVLVET